MIRHHFSRLLLSDKIMKPILTDNSDVVWIYFPSLSEYRSESVNSFYLFLKHKTFENVKILKKVSLYVILIMHIIFLVLPITYICLLRVIKRKFYNQLDSYSYIYRDLIFNCIMISMKFRLSIPAFTHSIFSCGGFYPRVLLCVTKRELEN